MTISLPGGVYFGAGDKIAWDEVLGGRTTRVVATVMTYRISGRHQIMQCEAEGRGICTVVVTYTRSGDDVHVNIEPVNHEHAAAFGDAVLCGREPRAPVNVIARTLAAALVAAQSKDAEDA